MGFFDFLRRKKTSALLEGSKEFLINYGRITDGIIIDIETTTGGDEIVIYAYTLNGVDFESSELLTGDQRRNPLKFAPGARVGVRYDPKNQGNSTLD